MDTSTSMILFGIFAIVYVFYKVTRRSALDKLPGPPSKSFLLGNLAELLQNQAGLTEFSWQEAYGDVVKFKGSFGTTRLLISDPKSLQHILQTSGYRWPKSSERKELSRLAVGHGITWADGDVHKRQRKVMLPGFGMPEAKNFLPIFFSCAASMGKHWSDILSISENQSHVFNIPEWTYRATLDAIGQAAFDYNFGATDDHENELGNAYQNMMLKTFGTPSNTALITMDALRFLPPRLVGLFNDINPSARFETVRRVEKAANAVAKTLISEKTSALLHGSIKNDIMSILVKANAGENPKGRMTEYEMISQMRTLMLAGHETTSNTVSWLLYELARNPELQRKLRAEIRAAKKVATARGDSQLNSQDLEGIPLLGATVKEILRYHPVLLHLYRTAHEDDVLPLSNPITTTTGEVLTELPIPKGTRVILPVPVYNRNKDIFGEDAHTFNPYRWLEPDRIKRGASVGPFANLATFSGGVRSCLGWRFAVIELHAFIVELLSNFEFSATPQVEKIRREPALIMLPTVEGEIGRGAQLPLKVAFAPKDEE